MGGLPLAHEQAAAYCERLEISLDEYRKRFEAAPALAFGQTVREMRLAGGIAQEALAALVGVERSHFGKIERGEHAPHFALIFHIAAALGCKASDLVKATEGKLKSGIRT